MPLNILSPLSSPEEVEPLINAGAQELYCGVLPDEWRTRYSVAASLNRRQEDNPVINTTPHMKSFNELAESVRRAEPGGVPVILTINEHYYNNEQYPAITDYIERALSCGVNTFIAGDPGIILTIREIDPSAHIHISTAGTTFNAETVHFYRDLGARRVILPRHLSLEEIQQIAGRVEGIELEAFILNSRCANIDGFCTFHHGLAEWIPDKDKKRDYENACMMLYKISADVRGCSQQEAEHLLSEKVSWERQHFWSAMHIDDRPCGACALYEFEALGLAGVKIVGRQNKTEKKLHDTAFIKHLLSYLRTRKPSREDFRRYSQKKYQEQYERPCIIFNCYYPSVLIESSRPQQADAAKTEAAD